MSTRLMDLISAVPRRREIGIAEWSEDQSPLDNASVSESWTRDHLPDRIGYRVELRLSTEILCDEGHVHEGIEEAKRNLIHYVYRDIHDAYSDLRVAVATRNYAAVRRATQRIEAILRP